MPVARSIAVAFALLLVAGEVAAASRFWNGNLSSNWFLSLNWNELATPGAADGAFFPENGWARTQVDVTASTVISNLVVRSPTNAQYTFTGSNGAVLDATGEMQFVNADRQALNLHTVSSLTLASPEIKVFHNAVLSLNSSTVLTNKIGTFADGRIDVNSGSSVQTLEYYFVEPTGEFRVNSGGELRIAGDTTLFRGLTRVNSGGELNASEGVDLEYNGSARLEFADSHAVDNFVHLKATGGGDITAGGFLDVGNGAIGSLTVTGAGSTLTAQSSTSDWGRDSTGNATVTISNSGVATAIALRAGGNSATFVGNVTSGGTLRTTSTFRMGGGTTNRTVSLTVNGGTLETAGLATFDNKASLSLVSGTVNFNGGATFNAGSLPIWAGGVMNLGANSTLLIDGTDFVKSSGAGFIFTNTTTTRIRNGGNFQTPSYFDLGNATLDMSGGFLSAGTAGGSPSDWGANSATVATLSNNSRATYSSGLRLSFNATSTSSTSATLTTGAQIQPSFFSTGGGALSTVTLNVNGGRIVSPGQVGLFRGTTTTISTAGRIEGQDVVLGSSGGTTVTTVTGVGSLLNATGVLKAGSEGTSLLTVSAGSEARSGGATILGEFANSSSTVTVTGAGSKLTVGGGLTVGGAGGAALQVQNGGLATVTGSVFVNSSSSIFLGDASRMELPTGQAITLEGELEVRGGPTLAAEIDADVVNDAGVFRLYDANANRGLTMLADSEMFVDNATVDSLDQIGGSIHFSLRSALDFDDLFIVETATFGPNATFVVSLENGYSPAAGATFPIFGSGSTITGGPNFDFTAAVLPSGLSWAVAFGPGSLGLAVVSVPVLAGDYNSDGFVNAADYTLWRDNVGAAAGTLPNDPAGGVIGNAQYTQWAANYGASGNTTAVSAATSVPEPSAAVLLLLAVGSRIATRSEVRRRAAQLQTSRVSDRVAISLLGIRGEQVPSATGSVTMSALAIIPLLLKMSKSYIS
jgi:T5SS/PEP-CTERM-associated repeat protein